MTLQKFCWGLFPIVALFIIGGCTITRPESNLQITQSTNQSKDLPSIYSAFQASKGKVYTLNPTMSNIHIFAFRGGKAPSLGHNHVLTTSNFAGFVYLPDQNLKNARFDLEFRLDQLEIDNANMRSHLGEAFSSTPTPNEIQRTRDHMLGEDNLQAMQFPYVRIHSLNISGEAPKMAAELLFELHGQQKQMLIPLNIDIKKDSISVSGEFVIRQTDFGIKPYSVLGGFLAVQNEVIIEFTLIGT